MESTDLRRGVRPRLARRFSFSGLRSDHVIYFGAIFSFLVGCAAELAWLLGAYRFLALGTRYPMHMDTGLFCILAGVGLFAAMQQMYRVSRFVGIAIALASNLHFAADLAGFSISVHNLLPHITASVLSRAEMRCIQIAPATAVVFFLFGCGPALLSKTTSDQVLGAIAALGTVMTSIGCIALVGYKLQICGVALHNSVMAHMAILTVLCSSALGISLCAMLWKASRFTRHDLSSSAAALAVIGLILIFGGIDAAVFVNVRTTHTMTGDVMEQSAIREQSIQLLTRAVLTSYAAAVLLIALALYIVWTESKRRNAVERKLRENELYLEDRVKQRTQALDAEIAIRIQTEENLRQAERLLEAALRFAGIAAWVWDYQEDRVCWTGNMQAIFGRESSELDTFIKFSNLIHPNDRSRMVQKIAISVTSGADYEDQFRVLLPVGEYRWISGIGGVVRDEHGQIIHMAGCQLRCIRSGRVTLIAARSGGFAGAALFG